MTERILRLSHLSSIRLNGIGKNIVSSVETIFLTLQMKWFTIYLTDLDTVIILI